MEFKTSISKIIPDDHIIRDEKLSNLIQKSSFADTIFLLLSGKKPTKAQSKIFEAALISVIDHGMGTTSSMAARFVASGGNEVNTSVAAGVMALGDYHGGAIEKTMQQLMQITLVKNFVSDALENKKTIYGFGHKIYKDTDPRVNQLLEICQKVKFNSAHIDTLKSIEIEIRKQKGKKIPLNIDGLLAAILLEFGFNPQQGRGFFIIARTPGLVAQVVEELDSKEPVRRVDEQDIVYTGKG